MLLRCGILGLHHEGRARRGACGEAADRQAAGPRLHAPLHEDAGVGKEKSPVLYASSEFVSSAVPARKAGSVDAVRTPGRPIWCVSRGGGSGQFADMNCVHMYM